MLDEGRCIREEMARSVAEAPQWGVEYHVQKTKALGFNISIRQLHHNKSWSLGIAH